MTAQEMLDQAQAIVNGDRQADYGHPRDNHGCTAALWTFYLRRRIMAKHEQGLGDITALDARDVCWLNILQKASRDANRRKDDNLVDAIGYALNAAMLDDVDPHNVTDKPYATPQQDPHCPGFPPPPAGETWHNPDGLTPAQVGVKDGWRLLLASEIDAANSDEWCEEWFGDYDAWVDGCSGTSLDATYRTREPLPGGKDAGAEKANQKKGAGV